MGCSVFTISLALALLVLLAGLFLLAYSKKEGLGIITKIASYIAVTFGAVVFVGGLICAMTCGSCHKKQGCKKDSCSKEMRQECSKSDSKCSSASTCTKESGACAQTSSSKTETNGCCGESTSKKGETCSKEGKE